MSSNNFFLIEDEMNSLMYFRIAEAFKERMNSKSTLESGMLHEANLIEFIRLMETNPLEEFRRANSFQQVMYENYEYNLNYFNKKFINITSLLTFIEERFLKEYGEISFLLEEIEGKKKRINQKKSALSLWKENVSFLHLESFLNRDYLKDTYAKGKKLSINYDSGLCLLPIKASKDVKIDTISIVSGNGKSGNSDLEVETSTQDLSNMLDKKPNTYYEYERLDSGPLELELEFVFSRKEIVNCIEIMPFINSDSLGFEIETIEFFRGKRDSISIKKLSSKESFFVNSGGENERFTINFLPVECVSFIIKFRQEFSSITNRERRLKSFERKRFQIAIREIEAKKIKFDASGSISSKAIPILSEVFAGESELKIFPSRKELYSVEQSVFCENKWKDLDFNELKSETFLLNGDDSFKWKMDLIRLDDEFKNKASYEANLSELKQIKKVVSNKVNPCNLVFEGEVKKENLTVFCESGLNRTSNLKRQKVLQYFKSNAMKLDFQINGNNLLVADGLVVKMDLPISLKEMRIDSEEIKVSVNNIEYDEVSAIEDLDNGNYFVSYSDNCILFLKDLLPAQGRVKWRLVPEQLRFDSKSNYVYSKFKFFPDPDLQKIDIYYLSNRLEVGEVSLKPGRKRFFLREGGILKSSIRFKGSGSFTNVASLNDLNNYSGNSIAWYFEEKSGVLFLNESLNSRSLSKVVYSYRERKKMNIGEYEIWEHDSTPVGIKIPIENFSSERVTEVLYSGNQERFSNVLNESETRTKVFDNSDLTGVERRAFELSYENIVKNSFIVEKFIFENPFEGNVKEVEFIDGASEFLSIIRVDEEYTNSLLASGNTVTFSIGARSLFYKPTGIVFEDNGEYFPQGQEQSSLNAVSTLGDWFVSEDGDVTVYIGNGNYLPAGIRYSYFYRKNNVENQANYFSVDYENSIVYFSGDIKRSELSKVEYRVSNYVAEYDILKKVKDYKVDFSNKKVEINSSEFLLDRGRVYLFYKKNLFSYNLENVREYFSPLIYESRFSFK